MTPNERIENVNGHSVPSEPEFVEIPINFPENPIPDLLLADKEEIDLWIESNVPENLRANVVRFVDILREDIDSLKPDKKD